jgi:hypothetical protein
MRVWDNPLHGSGRESLGNRLLAAPAATAATATTTASASPGAFTGSGRPRGRRGALGFFSSRLGFVFRLGEGRNFRFVVTRFVTCLVTRAGTRLARCARRFRVEIRGLQGRRRRLTSLLGSFFLAAL